MMTVVTTGFRLRNQHKTPAEPSQSTCTRSYTADKILLFFTVKQTCIQCLCYMPIHNEY